MDLDQFSGDLPPAALNLLKLQQEREAEQRRLSLQQAEDLEYMSRKPLVDPLMAWAVGVGQGDADTLGNSGRMALEAMQGNARNRQALQMEASKLRNNPASSDLLDKMAGPLLRSTSLGGPGGTFRNSAGNLVYKAGTRYYEEIPDKTHPKGYRLEEVISSEKNIFPPGSALDKAHKQTEKIFEMFRDGGAFEDRGDGKPWSDEMIANWWDATFQDVATKMMNFAANTKGVIPVPGPLANPMLGQSQTPQAKGQLPPVQMKGLPHRSGSVFPGSPLNAPSASAVSPGGPPMAPPSPTAAAAPGTPPGFPNQPPPIAVPGTLSPDQIKQKELDDLVRQRDSMSADDPRRAEVNRNITMIRRENPKLVIKTHRMLKQDEGYGAQEGKDLAIERKNYGELYLNAGKLENQLATLRGLYTSNPKGIVSGQLAPVFKGLKSGLESLGFKSVKDSARLEDVIKSMTTNISLHARTAEGGNLLPGSMSNYEDQLLQKMGADLSLTTQGRLQLIDFMVEVARANKRMAGYATEYEKKHGRLDAGWNAVRERKAREEMAKLALLNKRIMAQYQKGAR